MVRCLEFVWLYGELSRCIDVRTQSLCDTDAVSRSAVWIEERLALSRELLVDPLNHLLALLDSIEMLQIEQFLLRLTCVFS